MLCKSLLVIGRSLFQLMPFFQLVHTECKWIFLEENLPWSLHVTHILSQLSEKHGSIAFSLIYSLPTTTKRGHSKNPMSSSALQLTVSRNDHAAKKVLIQDNSWVVRPTRKTSTFTFLQIPNLSFCTVRHQCQVHRLSHNQAGRICAPLTALFASSPPLTKGSLSLRTASISGVDTVSEDRRE